VYAQTFTAFHLCIQNVSLYRELNTLCWLKLTALLMVTTGKYYYPDDRQCSLYYIKGPLSTNAQHELHFSTYPPEIA
jgi:hypothetical protein